MFLCGEISSLGPLVPETDVICTKFHKLAYNYQAFEYIQKRVMDQHNKARVRRTFDFGFISVVRLQALRRKKGMVHQNQVLRWSEIAPCLIITSSQDYTWDYKKI